MKRNYPTVSVITLTKNRADLLDANLISLRGQLSRTDEIIIVDNDSTDHTNAILRNHARFLPIRVIHKKYRSYPELYNLGLSRAKKDVIVFFDDDCIASPAFISRIRNAHLTRPGMAIQGMTYSIPKGNIYADIMGDHYRAFLQNNLLPGSKLRILDNKNASISRSLIGAVGGFSHTMTRGSEDIELAIRLRRNEIPIYFDRSIVCYHHERTTLAGFIRQHLRFAASEGYLDAVVVPAERIQLVTWNKFRIQMIYACSREISYLKEGNIRSALLNPILIILLACIRVWGYATNRWPGKVVPPFAKGGITTL